MQYVFNERREYIQTIEFKNTNPILNVEKINGFKEEGVVGTIVKKEFSYSFDNIHWSPWETLTSANIQTKPDFQDKKYLYLHLRFTRSNVAAGNIRSFYLLYTSKNPTEASQIDPSDYFDLRKHYGGLPEILDFENVGTGAGVWRDTSFGENLTTVHLRKIHGSQAISVTENANDIIIGLDASFSTNAENIGFGDVSIYSGKSINDDLQFRTLKGEPGRVILTSDASGTITIDVSILTKDPSLEDIYNSLAVIGVSLGTLESSINDIYLDLSTKQDIIPDGTYVKEASLGEGLFWNPSTGLLDVSTIGGMPFAGEISTGYVYYDTSLDSALAMPFDVGGIDAGTTVADLYGDSVTKILNDLLFPTVDPTYVYPSSSFNDNVSDLQEIGASINITFTASFDRGEILLNGVFQNYRSGLPNTYTYTGTGILGSISSISLTDVSILTGYTVIQGTQSWTNTVSYDEGPQPLNNKGEFFESPYPAGTTSVKTTTITGVYPYFATTVGITTQTKQPLASMTAAYWQPLSSMVAESGIDKQTAWFPQAFSMITGIQQFNTNNNQWDWIDGSKTASLLKFTVTSTQININGNNINYWVYTHNGSIVGARQLRFYTT